MTLINTYIRVPTNTANRPGTNNMARTPFRPNPIRHSRVGHGFGSADGSKPRHSRRVSIDALNRPGGMSNASTTNSCDSSATPVIRESVISDDTCQQQYLKRRPASTNISPSYSTNTREYLKSRAKTFEQNASPHQLQTVSGVDADGNPVYCDVDHQPVPKNHKYYAAGAVTSGTRIERLKYEATRRRRGVRNLPPPYMNDAKCKKC